ncbi:MAG: NAD(P)/FAD-dependent oxidoreductase [Eubacteriales bacterium]|nr:NAD(P)/FAD-dependent oxidoreductase [Eubacteriales bacterium]
MEKKRVIVVGGGASGLMAAIIAAREGAAVTVLEHNDRPGRKICATGNGRCNLTNTEMPADAFRGTDPGFVRGILEQFPVTKTIRFFTELGIYTINKNGYLYPRSAQASCVTEVLCMEARSRKVKIKTNEHVTGITCENSLWKVHTDGWAYEGDAVILANGSCASNLLGADGSGYEMARTLGHTVIRPLPALTGLKCNYRPVSEYSTRKVPDFKKGKKSRNPFTIWAGVRTEGELTLVIENEPPRIQRGELQLTDYGISGIPVFQLSRYAVRALEEGKKARMTVNFLPEFSKERLHVFLETRQKNCPYKDTREMLLGLFPDKLIQVLCQAPDLEEAILAFPLTITGGMDFKQAQVCSGGVDTAGINPETMESKLHPGLYFAGELVDIDGTCGGYNLQWAWSSGAVAGYHAAKENL